MLDKKMLLVLSVALVSMAATPAVAHRADLITAKGKVGPIQNGETTISDMRDLFGDPSERKVVRVGCSRVIKLRWGNELQTYTYRGDDSRHIIDVKVLARRVHAGDAVYRIHTYKGLRVGDSEAKVKELYPDSAAGEPHNGHTHYLLGDRGTKLLAKVVDGFVVQLEAAPYEYC